MEHHTFVYQGLTKKQKISDNVILTTVVCPKDMANSKDPDQTAFYVRSGSTLFAQTCP